MSRQKRSFTIGEEISHSISHGIGAALGIAALVILVALAAGQRDAWRVVSFSIYGGSLILLYLASTLYHGIQHRTAKYVFEVLDHDAIYLLIAGTYTPFLLVTMRGPWGWSLFGVIWILAITGIVFKSIFMHRMEKVSLAIYILMGWLIIIAAKPMMAHMPKAGFVWLLGGGLCYTIGAVFYVWRRLKFSHFIWHLFVLVGSILHFFCILLYVLPED
ncbi:hemolysin III family protein [bacterium]|nr:hemolysin III family protein [bacterium]